MAALAALLPGSGQRLATIGLLCLQHAQVARSAPRRLVVLLTVLVSSLATPALTQEAVAVRAGIHPGFGRLVLEWPAPVEITGRQEENRFELRFGRPLAVALDDALARLSAYLTAARLSFDARQLALELAPGIAVRQSVQAGRIVVLDLMPALPSEEVEVRSGRHDGFGRIVFDWPAPITFDAARTEQSVVIRFGRAGRIDAAKPAARLGDWLANAVVTSRDGQSEVRLEMPPGVDARVFQVDARRVAVDLSAAPGRSAEADLAATPRPPGPATARPALRPTLGPTSEAATPPPARSAHVAPAPGVRDTGALLDFAWTHPVAAAVFMRGGHLWVVFAAETSRPEDLVVPPTLRDYLGRGEHVEASGGTAVRFALRRPVSIETRREDGTWRIRLSEDARAARPLHPLRLAAPARLRLDPGEPPRLVSVRDPATGDQLTVWPLLQADRGQPHQSFAELELLATAQGLAWRLRSDRVQARILEETVEFNAPGGLVLSEPPGNPARPAHGAAAPAAVPMSQPDLPAAEAEPAILLSPHPPAAETEPPGNPARPTGDAAAPGALPPAEPEPAVVPSPRPPAAETEPARGPAPVADGHGRPAAAAAPLVGLIGWGLDPAYTAPQRRRALLQTLAQAAPDGRDAHRLELARYYLSKGLGAEALAVLGTVEQNEAKPSGRARQALTGAAELLMGRFDAAAAALGPAFFDHDPEVALWRCALAAGRRDWPGAARELERSEQILATYPAALRLRLGVAAATAAMESEDAGLAATLLAQLAGLETGPGERARLAFLSGLARARAGATEAADQIWRTLELDGPGAVRIEAAFARTTLLLEAGALTPAEAIARLAATRGLWPGHPREEEMLRALAQMHADAGDRAGALRTWRELLDRFPAIADAPAISARTREALIEVLRAEGEAEFGPLQAYALFREFEPLIPNDQRGDGVRRRMAERLGQLDLIRPAAALLEPLLAERLAGVERAEAGADLAELWLREPAPEAALSALEQSRVEAALPPVLDQRRRILQADALARLEDRTAALALLDGLHTPAADALRVGILWQEQDWPRVVSTIEQALERRAPRPFSESEQGLVLQLALAHGRLGDTAALEQLRARFAEALRGLTVEPAFLMATSAPAPLSDPAAVLAAAQQHLRQVRGFLEAERARN